MRKYALGDEYGHYILRFYKRVIINRFLFISFDRFFQIAQKFRKKLNSKEQE